MARGEIATPLNRSLIGHVHNPRTRRAFRTVEDRALLLDKEKEVLDEIVCLRSVSEDPGRYAAHNSRIALEEKSECFLIALCNKCQQVFVCWRLTQLLKVRNLVNSSLWYTQSGEPRCRGRAHSATSTEKFGEKRFCKMRNAFRRNRFIIMGRFELSWPRVADTFSLFLDLKRLLDWCSAVLGRN